MYANFQQFPMNWCFRRNSQTKISTFYFNKSENFCLKVSPVAPFYWKLLKIGIHSAKDIRKDAHVLQVRGSAPAPPSKSCQRSLWMLPRLVKRLEEEATTSGYGVMALKGITFKEFKDFCFFLNNLEDFQV